jgi:adenosylcobyric acid synthase
MLGRTIADPHGVEGPAGSVAGLGLLDVATALAVDKTTVAVSARDVATGLHVAGYEIHLGLTTGPDTARPLLDLGDRVDGARSPDGRVSGTYVHGLFASDEFRRAFLSLADSGVDYETDVEAALDALAEHVEAHVDVDGLLKIAGYTSQTISDPSATRKKSAALAAQ